MDVSQTTLYSRGDQELTVLHQRFESCINLYLRTFTNIQASRHCFQQVVANTRYYHSMLVAEIVGLQHGGVSEPAGGKSLIQMLEELQWMEQQVSAWTYQNICTNILKIDINWQCPGPRHFLVLPADFASWDDANPSTHQFRIYFLCDIPAHIGVNDGIPRHVHLSNHSGYNLERPDEFFQAYRDYALQMLQKVKHGHTDSVCRVPPLNTFEILQGCSVDTDGSGLSKDTLEPLVDKAIQYLSYLWTAKVTPSRNRSTEVITFLTIKDGDNAQGNLLRSIGTDQSVYWMCQEHADQVVYQPPLKRLKTFVHRHGGHVDMQQATLRVELLSITIADQFSALLTGTKTKFEISIKVCWKATCSYMERFCREISATNTVTLEIDGLNFDMHPKDQAQFPNDPFAKIIQQPKLQFITFLNYPEPQMQRIYTNNCALQISRPPMQPSPSYSWAVLRFEIVNFGDTVSTTRTETKRGSAARKLQSKLAMHGIPEDSMITLYRETWEGVFSLQEGAFVQVHSSDMQYPRTRAASGSLKSLTLNMSQDLSDERLDKELLDIVRNNFGLQELNISTPGRHVLFQAEQITRTWGTSSSPLYLTLIDRLQCGQGRIVAQMAIHGKGVNYGRYVVAKVQGSDTQSLHRPPQVSNVPAMLDFLRWDCEHVLSLRSDYSAYFLGIATRHDPWVLNSFTLDISILSCVGIYSLQDVFRVSNLEYLVVACNAFDTSLSTAVRDVLGSVKWPTIKSLVLLGDNIDMWMQLWPPAIDPRLLYVDIHGSESVLQQLSHSSVLFLHQLISSSPVMELRLKNVQMHDKRDWILIIEGLDPLSLETLHLCTSGSSQLMSATDAFGLFISMSSPMDQPGDHARAIFKALTLDISSLLFQDLSRVQNFLCQCRVEQLHVVCTAFEANLSGSIAQILASVWWPTVESLMLTGDCIDDWTSVWPTEFEHRLQRLEICGTVSCAQDLSHPSVRFVQHLVGTKTMEAVRFENVRLLKKEDWVLIIDAMDPVLLRSFRRCKVGNEQLSLSKIAVDLYISKWTVKEQ